MNRMVGTQRSPFLGKAGCKPGYMGCWATRNPSLLICSSDGQYRVQTGTSRATPGKSVELFWDCSCPFPWQHHSQQQKFRRRWANVSARQTNGCVPSQKDSGCSAEGMSPSLLTPWNRTLLFRVEKQIFTAVFIPCLWAFLRRKAPGTCQQTAGHGHPSSKCHLHPPQPQPRQSSSRWAFLAVFFC